MKHNISENACLNVSDQLDVSCVVYHMKPTVPPVAAEFRLLSVSSVHACVHLWYLSGLVVDALFVGRHKRIPLCVFVCILLDEGFRLQLLSVGIRSALTTLIVLDEANHLNETMQARLFLSLRLI